MKPRIRIGTRGSQLALVQARWVQARLQERYPDHSVELVTITTSGDRFLDRPLSAIGGKGLFVKEIEDALASGTVDVAVHSMKDVPAEVHPGLVIAAIPEREAAHDVLLTPHGPDLSALPHGARLGTSSLRRMALVRARRPDLDVVPLRGNVDTRLRKLDAAAVDAIVLAAAGLRRLGITRTDAAVCDPAEFVPAIGQGALAIETRDDATAIRIAVLDHGPTRIAVTAERAFLRHVGGSCRTPLAAYATLHDAAVHVDALIASPDGTTVIRGTRTGPTSAAAALGTELASELLARGGADILAALEAAAQTPDAR